MSKFNLTAQERQSLESFCIREMQNLGIIGPNLAKASTEAVRIANSNENHMVDGRGDAVALAARLMMESAISDHTSQEMWDAIQKNAALDSDFIKNVDKVLAHEDLIMDAVTDSVEKFFAADEQISEKIKRAPIVSKAELQKKAEPGDIILIYRNPNTSKFTVRLFNKVSSWFTRSSFGSVKIIGENSEYVYGWGVSMRVDGLRRLMLNHFLDTLGGALLCKVRGASPAQRAKVLEYCKNVMKDKSTSYSTMSAIGTIFLHNSKDPKKDIKSYKKQICTSLPILAYRYAGFDLGVRTDPLYTYPVDLLKSDKIVPAAFYLLKSER